MKIEVKLRGINRQQELRGFLLEQINELEGLIPMTSAQVFVEYQTDMMPSYWLWANLVVPGQHIYAIARDCTPLAAWLKACKDLKREIKRRKLRLVAKRKSKLQLRAAHGKQAGVSSK